MKSCAIVGVAILAAVLYGIVHDQVTTRVCVEYFKIRSESFGYLEGSMLPVTRSTASPAASTST